MKIGLIVGKTPSGGLSTYINELTNALRKYENAEVNRYIYYTSILQPKEIEDDQKNDWTVFDPNMTNDEIADILNQNDCVFCLFHVCYKQVKESEVLSYMDLLQNKIKVKKAIFFNEHNPTSIKKNYGLDYMCRKDFLLSFDHICQFDDFIPSAKLLQSIIGDDEYSKRFVPLHLMYDMNGDPKKWGKPEDRIKAVEYLGRFVSIKDPQRLIRAKEWLDKSGYVIEMRGLIRMISLIGIPDLCYKFVDGQKTDEPSEKVTWVKKGWMKEQGFEDQGDVLYYPLEKRDGRIFIFGNYDNKTIYNYIKNAAYVCDFFNLKKDDYCPPQHLEYVMFEFINNGIITILDSQIGRTAYLYKDGKKTDRRFDQVSIALYLNKDLSNIEEVIEKMNFLYDNPNEYEKFRLSAFNLIKEHASPKNIVRTLCENMKLS